MRKKSSADYARNAAEGEARLSNWHGWERKSRSCICASPATENVVVTHYWITMKWVDKAGAGKESTTRICHTWIKTPDGWQIIGGMSCPALDRKS